MKIIISPAKTMNVENDLYLHKNRPTFLKESEHILNKLKSMNLEELIELWNVSEKLGINAYEKILNSNLEKNLTPAIFAYEGLQYKHIGAKVLSDNAISYIEDHLCILSGVYGCLKSLDGIMPYRLEMQAHLEGCFEGKNYKNLYEFWGSKIYENLMKDNEDRTIINLASKEYSDCVNPYIKKGDRFITCNFAEYVGDKLKIKATKAKIARGSMVRYLAENKIDNVEKIKEFNLLGYSFDEKLSDTENIIFVLKK